MAAPPHLPLAGYTAAASNLFVDAGDVDVMAKNELVTPLGDSAMDETNDALKVTLATALAGEDVTNDVTKVEQRGADCGR